MRFFRWFAGPVKRFVQMVAEPRRMSSDAATERMRTDLRAMRRLRAEETEWALRWLLAGTRGLSFGPLGSIRGIVDWRDGIGIIGPVEGRFSSCCDGAVSGIVAELRCWQPVIYLVKATYCGACGRWETSHGGFNHGPLSGIENLRGHLRLPDAPPQLMTQTGIYR